MVSQPARDGPAVSYTRVVAQRIVADAGRSPSYPRLGGGGGGGRGDGGGGGGRGDGGGGREKGEGEIVEVEVEGRRGDGGGRRGKGEG